MEYRGQNEEDTEKTHPTARPPGPGFSGGGATRFPFAGTQLTSINTPTDCYLISSLPALSSVDSQPMHSFIHSTNITLLGLSPGQVLKEHKSCRRTELEVDAPLHMESGQG